jgi:hypothetical protein
VIIGQEHARPIGRVRRVAFVALAPSHLKNWTLCAHSTVQSRSKSALALYISSSITLLSCKTGPLRKGAVRDFTNI